MLSVHTGELLAFGAAKWRQDGVLGRVMMREFGFEVV